MGKHFYGKAADKHEAMRLANSYAKKYRKGVCYTPSKEKSCVFDESTKLWTCMAAAHHHAGSCGTYELDCDGSGDWRVDIGWSFGQQGEASPAGQPAQIANPGAGLGDDVYTDALPEDYEAA
ncbi:MULTISPECIES: hypothetical protein [unclassified Cupriavidus]|uniref:hypothetical protein n=1 Tax=unclassified Cupriavidus TaxID=2640874 RepID=UPI0012EC8C28|nr:MULTISPECIES: hypothetical protein [unclassified Cupriavidus]MBP0633000.1 hypothetical protein [Cupriavidus sp. AcVe19-1a]